eukprot:2225517-Rhodomonas_salina.1
MWTGSRGHCFEHRSPRPDSSLWVGGVDTLSKKQAGEPVMVPRAADTMILPHALETGEWILG